MQNDLDKLSRNDKYKKISRIKKFLNFLFGKIHEKRMFYVDKSLDEKNDKNVRDKLLRLKDFKFFERQTFAKIAKICENFSRKSFFG